MSGSQLDGATLVVLTTGLSESCRLALERSAARSGLKLSIRSVSDISELGGIPAWAVPTCLRLYTGDICHDFDRALYLDSDMVAVSSLDPLIDIDLDGRTAAAVINYPPLDVIRVAIRSSQRGTADGNARYFNAGVLLIDTARWAQRSIGVESRSYLSRYPTTRLFDQDALNIALVHDWLELDKEWNTPAGALSDAPMFGGLIRMSPALAETFQQWKEAQQRPRILHFTGYPKPWDKDYPWPALRDQFYQFVLPEFDKNWPASGAPATITLESGERTRQFRRT
jgi:lipopolysaccharide biosynthesis glycosyltransferase